MGLAPCGRAEGGNSGLRPHVEYKTISWGFVLTKRRTLRAHYGRVKTAENSANHFLGTPKPGRRTAPKSFNSAGC